MFAKAKAFWHRRKTWQKVLIVLLGMALIGAFIPDEDPGTPQNELSANDDGSRSSEAGKEPTKQEPETAPSEEEPSSESGTPKEVKPDAAAKLDEVARGVTVNGINMGAYETDPFVMGELADVVMKVDSTYATTREAYLGKMMIVARDVANAAMNMDGIKRVHIIVESDGAFGSPKDSLAINLLYDKEKVTPVKWGNLESPEELLSEATIKDVDPSLLK